MPTPFKRLVVLMMENRSFDHMLGYLKSADYPIEGLNGDETNISADEGPPIRVSPDARDVNDLNPDPSHEFPDINVQIFGNAEGIDTGQTMQGFVQNYATDSGNAQRGENIMKCFHEDSLPVLSTLAKQFAVCDHWYSSLPASTIPNRLFAHAAWSGDSLTQDAILAPAIAKTIFQIIDDKENLDATFRIYTSGSTILMANLYLMHRQSKFSDMRDFFQDCKDNALPEYSFIEPSYDGVSATSQHPDFPVHQGEAFIAQVYNALRDSDAWQDTLLLIVYDEHGGLFDHVPPPKVAKADGSPFPDLPPTKDFGFKFDRLGVRVPAVFVSPWIEAGTILSQPFDHCSIVATARKMFCLDKTPFNWREAQAEKFDEIANRDTVRTDRVALPPVVVSDGGIPLKRDPVLDAAARGRALPAGGIMPTLQALAQTTRTANAPPVPTPPVVKPTDLAILMAQAMEHSLGLLGIKPSKTVHQIYSSQDAADYLHEVRNLLPKDGGQ